MKLLLTLDFPPEPGGIQHYLEGLVRHTYGPEDVVLAGCGPLMAKVKDRFAAKIHRCTFPLAAFNKKLALIALFFAFIPYARHSHYVRIECGNVYAAIIPWLISCIKPQSYRVYIYGTEIVQLSKRSFKNSLLKRFLQKAEHIYAITKYSTKRLRDAGVLTPVTLVPPRIEFPKTRPHKKSEPKDNTRILTVGRLVKHKGHATLVRAVAHLRTTRRVELTIIGNGPEEKALKALIDTLGLHDCVRILTGLPDEEKDREYENADIFVLPSLEMQKGTEGFGIVLLEAMARDIPIVASSVGGIVEVLDGGNCGVLVGPGSPEALREGIERALSEPGYRHSLVTKARKRLLENYVW